jgi:hypothetical protein
LDLDKIKIVDPQKYELLRQSHINLKKSENGRGGGGVSVLENLIS